MLSSFCVAHSKKTGDNMRIATNNPMVKEKFSALKPVFIDGTYEEVLDRVKKMIINEHLTLLTHPLSGSVKPNETYYKTICLTDIGSQYIDLESLEYIESAIEVSGKFLKSRPRPNWTEHVLKDFAFVDCSIAESTLERMGVQV